MDDWHSCLIRYPLKYKNYDYYKIYLLLLFNDRLARFIIMYVFLDCGSPKQTGYEFDTPEPNTKYCATVKVTCAVGYKTSPEKTSLRCQANGKWEKARGCTKIRKYSFTSLTRLYIKIKE